MLDFAGTIVSTIRSPDVASSSSDGSFKGMIIGTVGVIIAGVSVPLLLNWLNPDRPVSKPTIISIGGRVFDETSKRLLENVLVRLHVGTQEEQQNTDSEGRYAFSLEGFDPRIAGTIDFAASGYQPRSYNRPLQ